MFGSEIASTVIYTELIALSEVIAIGVTKVVGLPVLPQSAPLPGIAFYPEFSAYGAPLGSEVNYEQMRFVIKAMCEGTSTTPIDDVAQAQLDHFNGLIKNTVVSSINYTLTFDPNGELLPTTVVDGANFYRQLGTIYSVEITRGG